MPKGPRWEGGFVWIDEAGRRTFVIERRVAGRRYKISTRCHTERGAMEQLKRFEADPEGYDPAGGEKDERPPLLLSVKLTEEFLLWSRDSQANTPKWVGAQKRYLAWWAGQLAGQDLRKISVEDHLLPALKSAPGGRQPRIAVLKRFYSWLVGERRLLKPEEDPTFRTLTVPQARPEQLRRPKAIPIKRYRQVRDLLEEPWRSAVDVLAGTGWHLTELERFAAGGAVEPYTGRKAKGVVAVLVVPWAKSGEPHRTAVTAPVRDAAKVILERGAFRGDSLNAAIRKACKEATVDPIAPGSFRHSVATWAIDQGADPASVAAFLGHKSERTTKKFYATHATPAKVPTLR